MWNHSTACRWLAWVSLSFVFLTGTGTAIAAETVHLATSEREPYIGKRLPNRGYVHELVTTVFRKAGYTAVIRFYPLARALRLVENGALDGLVPYYRKPTMNDRLAFSAPFPGDQVGFLKRKAHHLELPVALRLDDPADLHKLRGYRIGVVRGASLSPAFDDATFLRKDSVATDFQNIMKLSMGRIDLAVIDKYTAADLVTHRVPHLIGQLEFLQTPTVANAFHLAFSRQADGYRQKLADFNASLKAMAEAGELAELTARHGFFPQKTHTPGKTKLTIATVDNPDMTIMRRLSAVYENANPHIELDWKVLDENTLRRRVTSDLAIADGQFDIMTISAFEAPIWAQKDRLVPIDNLPAEYDVADLLPSVVDSLSHAGRLYALPFYGESSMTFYRRDLFDQHGIVMP